MKRTLLSSIILLSLLLSACSKKENATPSSKKDTTTSAATPPTGTTGSNNNTGTTCDAQLADAENIAIFPADNAWNQDVSAAQVDPYSSQIIANFSTSKLKADFGSGF